MTFPDLPSPGQAPARRNAAEALVLPPDLARILSRQQGWRLGFSHLVLREYRRFLVLEAVSGQLLVPSRAVEQARRVHLGTPTDASHPENGPAYLDTLDLYRAIYGEPPRSCWPDPRQPGGKLHPQWKSASALLLGLGSVAAGLGSGRPTLALIGGGLLLTSALLAWKEPTSAEDLDEDSGGDSDGD